MLNFWIASFLAMTRSDDKKLVLGAWEIADQVRNDGRGCEYRVKRFPFGEIARFDGVNGVEC